MTKQMDIKVLGTGCPKCRQLEETVSRAVRESGIDADIEHVTEIARIIEYGVMCTPALVVDGTVRCAGRVPSLEEVKAFLS